MTLDTPMRITDAHAHAWAAEQADPPWRHDLGFRPTTLAPIDGYLAELDAAGVADGVLVQPSVYAFDHAYLERAIAMAPGRLRGVMLADPLDERVADHIRGLSRASEITGIRLMPLRAEREWFGPGSEVIWRTAADLGLTMTFLVRPDQVPEVADWAARFPGVPVVIDHMARPDLSEQPGPAAIEALLAASSVGNVHVKLSAIGSMSKLPAPYEDTLAWVRATADAYGPHRVMWGSDYPWVMDAGNMGLALAATRLALDGMSPGDSEAVFGRTARRLFGLEELPDGTGRR